MMIMIIYAIIFFCNISVCFVLHINILHLFYSNYENKSVP